MFADDRIVKGSLTGLDGLTVLLGGDKLELNPAKAAELTIAPRELDDRVDYSVIVKSGDKEVARLRDTLIETIDFGAPNRAKNGPDGALADCDTPALQQSEPLPPTKPSELFFTKTFEFRLRGTDVQQRSIDLPTMLSEYRIVASTNHVRTFVTRGPESAAASNLIGGVDVSLEGRRGTLPDLDSIVCTVQASDFGADDLVVVGVDITVFLLTRNNEP